MCKVVWHSSQSQYKLTELNITEDYCILLWFCNAVLVSAGPMTTDNDDDAAAANDEDAAADDAADDAY